MQAFFRVRPPRMKLTHITLYCLPLLLTACGDTRLERAGNGAMIGGITGFAVGGLCCADPPHGLLVGTYVGAAAGAAVGALLPRPIFMNWRDDVAEEPKQNPVPPPSQQPQAQTRLPAAAQVPLSANAAASSTNPYTPAPLGSPGRQFPVENPQPAYSAGPSMGGDLH
jgi:hypothetical protein